MLFNLTDYYIQIGFHCFWIEKQFRAFFYCNILGCQTNPCLNGGACVENVSGVTCQCASGYGGTFCDVIGMKPLELLIIILSNRFGNKLFDTSLHIFVISTVTVLTAFLCKSDNVILFSAGPLFCSFNTGTLCSFLSQALDDGDDWLFGTVGALSYFLCPLFVLTDRIHTKCDFAPSVWN